ncbi:hypothetical protein MLD38_034339 [Melastoma candidum]|uniref:Uncharacterized protein n=1 Tax=Melastoma candidum TaxID=119954 RepID=A0ACB9MBG8_9MYRT|nr:hypothetical protein MLD38_034339 [Melastoma candidum]
MLRLDLLLILSILLLSTPVLSDVVLSKVDRLVDLTSHIVRITSTLKVENVGKGPASEVIIVFPERQAKNLAYVTAATNAGKGKVKGPTTSLPVCIVNAEGLPPSLEAYSGVVA